MDRRAVAAVVGTVLAVVLVVAAATSDPVDLARRAPSFGLADDPRPLPVGEPDDAAPGDREEPPPGPVEIPRILGVVLEAVGFGLLAALLVYLGAAGWRRRPRLRWQRRVGVGLDGPDDLAAAVTADAADQRAALLRGEPRNAIVGCWLRLEAAVTDAGVAPDPTDTASELTARVLSTYPIDRDALDRLAALYREARFSSHPMDERSRAAAVDALDGVHEGLRRHASGLAPAP